MALLGPDHDLCMYKGHQFVLRARLSTTVMLKVTSHRA